MVESANPRGKPRWSSALLVALALAAALTAAQQQQPTPRPRPTFRAGTNYVRVDVYPSVDGRILDGLTAEDFELREDGVLQHIDAVEFVDPGPTVPDAVRVEPGTVQQSLDAAGDPRARLFVIFIDTYHLAWTSGYRAYLTFVDMLGRQIGERDLVALMTPEMSATSITFGRRTAAIEEILQRHFDVSRSGSGIIPLDEDDNWYLACYARTETIAWQMIERRHEKITLDALRDLSRFLAALRDERKAVFMVSDGWVPTTPDESLARPLDDQAPAPPKVGTGPDGRIRVGTGGDKQQGGSNRFLCDQDRMRLAREDHASEFRRMLDEANRSNVSFYAVDLRGLTTKEPPGRWMLRDMSSATDGVAIVNANDEAAGVRRAMEDMRGYYLLGYYSTNGKADGRFRSIKVSVKRPRVHVRARRGYVAPTEAELKAVSAAREARTAGSAGLSNDAGVAGGSPAPTAAKAVEGLARIRGDAVLHGLAGLTWQAGREGFVQPAVWVVGEFDATVAVRDEAWAKGAEVTVDLAGLDGATVERSARTLSRDSRFFLLRFDAAGHLAPGDYAVRVTVKPPGGTLGTTDTLQVSVPAPGAAGAAALVSQPLLFRRGPFSGLNWQAAGDLRFRRQERLKIEFHVAGPITASAVRLLDRSGNPLNLPVATAEREEDGGKVVSGEVTLAPLTVGDYVIEGSFTAGTTTQKVLAAFRIVP